MNGPFVRPESNVAAYGFRWNGKQGCSMGVMFYGLELLFLVTRDQFTCREDCLVALFHCMMLNDGKKCVGIGDEWTETSTDGGSETLPAGWNSSHDVYSLRYVSDSSADRYLLKIVKAGHSLLVNVLDVNEEKATGMSVNVPNHVSENFKEFSKAYMNLSEISTNFRKDVLSQLTKQSNESSGVRHPGSSGKADKPQQTEKLRDPVYRPMVPAQVRPDDSFPTIGRGDLDPFSTGVGGGMITDPSSFRFPPRPRRPNFGSFDPYGIPRGSVPPGARFDPLGPPGTGLGFSRPPDPDHLPPPGYDDMFM